MREARYGKLAVWVVVVGALFLLARWAYAQQTWSAGYEPGGHIEYECWSIASWTEWSAPENPVGLWAAVEEGPDLRWVARVTETSPWSFEEDAGAVVEEMMACRARFYGPWSSWFALQP